MPGAAGGSTHAIVFDGFGAGEYGAQGSYLVGWILHRQTLYYRGAFTGLNVLRYVDGSLGPRPEATDCTPPGLPANGTIIAMGTVMLPSGLNVWAAHTVDGLTAGIYRWLPPNGATTAVGSFPIATLSPAPPAELVPYQWVAGAPDSLNPTGSVFIASPASSGGGIFHVNFLLNSVTLLTGSPSGGLLCRYGSRLVSTAYPTIGVPGNQIVYSASDWAVWSGAAADGTTAGVITIGDTDPICALIPERHGLLIAKQGAPAGLVPGSQSMDQWYMLTGVPGVNSVVRPVAQSPVPLSHQHQTVLGDGTVVLVSGDGGGANSVPGRFNGAVGQSMRHLGWKGKAGPVRRLREPHDWLIVPKATSVTGPSGSAVGLLSRDGLITRHTLGAGVSDVQYAASVPQNDLVFVTDGGAAFSGASAKFNQWSAYADTPGVGASGIQKVPPAAQCWFTLPEWFDRSGAEVAVSSLLVDFAFWDYPGAKDGTLGLPATFDVTLTPLRAKNSGDSTPQTQHFVQAPGAPGKPLGLGVRLRQVFNFKHAYGNGFQVTVGNMQMVSIQKIIPVLVERGVQV